MSQNIRHIELLAPAKDYLSAVDAIDCGADAVYIGASRFGARYAAGNSIEDIASVVEYAHRFGAKVYATCNTLLFDEELDDARRQAEALVEVGVDALIVQDMAYCRMGLGVELHASTQTNCVDAERVAFFEQVGFSRAILERSLSKQQIAEIRAATTIELEAFVHGAICVSQSGRCFLSRSCGPRSGNRGECSQPCRQTYDLTDGKGRIYLKGKHLLSVRDLDLSARLGEMIDAGVTSFKIEGRLKDRAYVRNIVSLYRRLLDEEIAKRNDVERSSVGRSAIEFEPNASRTFTRAAGEYLFDGKSRGVASFDTPKAMGERIGRIVRVERRGIVLYCKHDLATGDGVCFIADGSLVGTNVVGVDGGRVQLNRYDGVAVGVELFRNYNRLFSQAVERSRVKRTIAVDFDLRFEECGISLSATDEEGVSVSTFVECATEDVRDRVKGEEALRKQLLRAGDTMFEVHNVAIENIRFVPMSVVGALRREVLERLENERKYRYSIIEKTQFIEKRYVKYPTAQLLPQDNVTNRLATEFYADHGVEYIAEALECCATTAGQCVVVSDYCIRRELGECLLKEPKLRGELYLERGEKRYRLDFDCKKCQMSLYDIL